MFIISLKLINLKIIQRAFGGTVNGTIKLLNLESGECIKTFVGHSSSISSVKNVLDDKLISGDSDGLMKIWKIETGEC